MSEIRLTAVAYAEGDAWVVQGIEHDIAAHAADLSDLPDAFMKAIVETIAISLHLGREPLQGIRPAPDKFRLMYERATAEINAVRSPAPAIGDIPPPRLAIRLAHAA